MKVYLLKIVENVVAKGKIIQYKMTDFIFCTIFQYVGTLGTVHRITERGDVRVQYDGCSNRWTFHPGALKKVFLVTKYLS